MPSKSLKRSTFDASFEFELEGFGFSEGSGIEGVSLEFKSLEKNSLIHLGHLRGGEFENMGKTTMWVSWNAGSVLLRSYSRTVTFRQGKKVDQQVFSPFCEQMEKSPRDEPKSTNAGVH